MTKKNIYAELGVDATKEEVRETFGKYIDTEYPDAFVNIITDPLDKKYVMTQHMDGDGSKIIQRLLQYEETKNSDVFSHAVDDALQMNLGDIAASGFVFGPIMITDVININNTFVPKNILMKKFATRFRELIDLHKSHGFDMYFLGGETADLSTQLQNVAFDVAVSTRAKKKEVITGNIQPNDKIYGFASYGQASWEEEYNSGIMSNGLTLARVGTIWRGYERKYPYLGIHQGRYKIQDSAGLLHHKTIGEALLSPTRHWSIVIRKILEKLKKINGYDLLHGISMNTGGGVTKISHLGNTITYKKRMPQLQEIFKLIQSETKESWQNIYQVFNCGVGIDIVGSSDKRLQKVLAEVSIETNIELFELGLCEKSHDSNNHVVIETDYGRYEY